MQPGHHVQCVRVRGLTGGEVPTNGLHPPDSHHNAAGCVATLYHPQAAEDGERPATFGFLLPDMPVLPGDLYLFLASGQTETVAALQKGEGPAR